MEKKQIILKKVKVHNLKSVDLTLAHNQLIVFTGVSGSGKSSLAFDTIYVEGQRRYIESLSTHARRHLGDMPKPDAEFISGISPTIAIEQKTAGKNPRSTVGTITGIYDYLRVLYARIGTAHCPISGEAVSPQSSKQIIQRILTLPPESRIFIFCPFAKGKKGEFKEDFTDLLRKGFMRVRLDGKIIDLNEQVSIDGKTAHDVDLLIDRLSVTEENRARISEAVIQALELGKGIMSVLNADTGEEKLYSEHAFSKKSQISYSPLEPQDFSFNHPDGMCPNCQGLGMLQEFNLDLIINHDLSISEDCCSVASSYQTVRYGNIYDNLARIYHFKIDTPWKKLSEKAREIFLFGTGDKWIRMHFVHPIKKSKWTDYVQWRGVLHEAKMRFQEAKSESYRKKMHAMMQESTCSVCLGQKIKPYPAATLIDGKKIAQLTAMPIEECMAFFDQIKLSDQDHLIAVELLKEIRRRLRFLLNVGLHYLNLDRTAPTLSGGESQRVRLASQIGSGLVGATYILDEPSIGLHPRDNSKLLETLKNLRDKGNTVIVVEHDEETIREADYLVDVGPLAGENGGEIVAQGSLDNLFSSKDSITGAYLSGRNKIPIPKKRRPAGKTAILIGKASHHNLKQINVKFPLNILMAVVGVSGSGKSSLITDTLYPALSNFLHRSSLQVGKYGSIKGLDHIDKVIAIDQTPIGRTPRSNPATYIKLLDEIRELFSQLPESVAHGFKAGRFSFNVKEGSCPHCGGMGMIKIDMDFMEDEWVSCQECHGRRFDENTLSVLYRGKSIYDILEMRVSEAYAFFEAIPQIKKKLEVLLQVGLDYLKIGQPSPTLSGGEAQRIKLAKELSRPETGKTFYILDEPTTGLHFYDINKLSQVLQALVDKGNTVLIIEHNMDLIKTADWLIELGPEGGEAGGKIIAEGTPEKMALKETPTGIALKKLFNPPKKVEKKIPFEADSCEVKWITIEGASQNNLKMVHAEIPRGQITLCTGPSGSGKSSFAFETIYAEGQRRYIESLSSFSRQFVKQMPKPKIERIEGLSASIAIEQKNHAGNPRSTIGTMTEAYDFLRIIFAHLGTAYCPDTGEKIQTISKDYVVSRLLDLSENTRVQILAPLSLRKNETFQHLKERLQKLGFLRLRINKKYYELDEDIPFKKEMKNEIMLVIDRLAIKKDVRQRLFEAVDQAASFAKGTLVADCDGKDLFFNLAFAVEKTGKSYLPITPHTFSFNTEEGMCLDCLGLGFQYGADLQNLPAIMNLTPIGLAYLFWQEYASPEALKIFEFVLEEEKIPKKTPLKNLQSEKIQILLNGSKKTINIKRKGFSIRWIGLNSVLARAAKNAPAEIKQSLIPLLDQSTCLSCKGTRLNPLARNVKIQEHSLPDVCALDIEHASLFLNSIQLKTGSQKFLEDTLNQLKNRLEFLNAIGLNYLSLDRSAPSLSNGETQRIRLSRQLGSGLTGCLYVLDEPTIGLHPYNNELLNKALKLLCALGNTLLLVEHDPLTIEIAHYILDFGPGAGKEGGQITARGILEEIKNNPASLTGAYLSGRKKIPIPLKRRLSKKRLIIKNAEIHNLNHLDVEFPIGVFNCVTGVSGSGKSSLINDLLRPAAEKLFSSRTKDLSIASIHQTQIFGLENFNKIVVMDQNPIGYTARADVSTYVDLLTPLRYLFASLAQAKTLGLQPKNFSYNHKKGMCTTCFGLGTRSIQMQFLPPVKVVCESCQGFRLNPLSLQVFYRDKHLGHLLKMSVLEARQFLDAIPKTVRILDVLLAVGLGYLTLGQEIASLSGGEAQRLRLSRELAKRSSGKTLYLFDEPTIGLHSEDILKLLKIFHELVLKGNTLIIIEHNLDVISNADHIVDLGPDAGKYGGKLIAAGTPEEVARNPGSRTAKYLDAYLNSSKRSQ